MEKRDYEVVVKHGIYTVIKYEKEYIGTEYAICPNFDAENFSWDSGSDNYFYTFADVIAALAYKLGSNMVKDKNQRMTEYKTGITYDRMSELATKFKDELFEYDSEDVLISVCKNEMEMDDKELEYFGIDYEVED